MKRLALLLPLLAGTAHAQELYFAEYQFQNPKINAMNLDGSNPHLLFAPSIAQWLPIGLTYRPQTGRIIWMDSAGPSEVMSANLDGSGQSTLATPAGFCRGPSLDASGRIFFSSGNQLRRVNADGTGEITLYTDPSADPLGNPRVDADNAHVYVGAGGEIKRMNLDGSSVKTIVRGISQPRAIGLDIQAGFIYWLDADTISDYVGRARLDDTQFTVLIDQSPNIVQSPGFTDLLVDPASGFLWYGDELTDRIYRSGLAGKGAASIYTSPTGLSPVAFTLSTGEPHQGLQDCNVNGISDDIDIAAGAPDCDNNGVIDTCQVNPCPQRTFLLDQGSDAANTSARVVGSMPDQFQIFQPFDVPAGGWTVAEIAIDGYTVSYAASGMTLKIFPDNGSGTLPNETTALGTATLSLRFNTSRVNWVYAAMPATLTPGRYWVRIEANAPTVYQSGANFGFSGLQSKSRRVSGTFTGLVGPIALRIIAAPPSCYPNCDGSTGSPALTPNDFQCFLDRFAAGETYANCDGSTGSPLLTANDFQCFLNGYAAGCT